MLVIIIRSIIIFAFLIFGMRLMGKRTIGQLQPYEFVIILAVADLACIPMQDVSTSIFYGLAPLGVVVLIHYFITLVTSKNIKFRKFLNGKPFIIIDQDGINYDCLIKLNIDVNDLLAMIRQQGYFSLLQIKFGIIETNGQLSILGNKQADEPQCVPVTLIVEGKILHDNLNVANIKEQEVLKMMADNNFVMKDILLMTAENKIIYIQPKNAKFLTLEVE
jgi:uncharacterized membrane protein YcaP (DUF421 family)